LARPGEAVPGGAVDVPGDVALVRH